MDIASLQSLITTHGYWVLAVGCLLEGETILVLAGIAAHSGYLDPVAVWTIAAVAGFLGDQIFFWLGRRHGAVVLAQWDSVARQADRVHRLLERYHAPVIIGVRFAYGLRIAGPIIIGTSKVRPSRFAFYNGIGAVIWATLVGGVGWVFGHTAERVLGQIRDAEGWLLGGLVLAGLVIWAIHHLRKP